MSLLTTLPSLEAKAPWKAHNAPSGFTLQTQKVDGSHWDRIRITTQSRLPPEKLCDAIWGKGAPPNEAGFKRREVIRETSNERWTYEQIQTPIVADRDYTMHAKRVNDEATHNCQVYFDTQNDQGPPPQKGIVRIPKVEGYWTVETNDTVETGAGQALVTYVLYTEPGGSIPAFLARGSQRKHALEWMQKILARAQNASQ